MPSKNDLIQLYREAVQAGIPLEEVDQHLERASVIFRESVETSRRDVSIRSRGRLRRILPVIFMTVGSLVLANAAWPILSYMLFTAPEIHRQALQAPVPEDQVLRYTASVPVISQLTQAIASTAEKRDMVQPIVLNEELDYTNLANWFDAEQSVPSTDVQERTYEIEIPSLGIKEAQVKIGGTDLTGNLIQYPTTAQPGEVGAPVIFGHSVLRQFYRPSISNPNRYKSIFSTIMTMRKGDEIIVRDQGVEYTYEVVEKHQVDPDDPFILEQRLDARQLKLITCTPEGTQLYRGVVIAQLVKVE